MYTIHMRFQVPQNLDVADTIFLGLSFKQILYLGGASGVTIFSFLFFGGIIGAIFIGGPFIFLAFLLSFFTYNTQSFIILLQAVIRFLSKGKIYIWNKEGNEKYTQRKISKETKNISSNVSFLPKTDKVRDLSNNLVFDEIETKEIEPKINI